MNDIIKTSSINYIAYLLVFVGYMTLTISLPLVGLHNHALPATTHQLQYGISILFLLFSISAISLSRIADMVGSYRVLFYAQPISITGLIIAAIAPSFWIFCAGLFLMGAGTGCYSSIARTLIAKHAVNHHHMRKSFSVFSILLTLAPLASTFLMIYSNSTSWRLGYAVMAGIEIFVLWQVIRVLKQMPVSKQPINLTQVLKGYSHCLIRPYFTLNVLYVSTGFTLIVSVLLGFAHNLFIIDLHLSAQKFMIFNILISVTYIVGIICFRQIASKIPNELIRVSFILVLIPAAIWFYFATSLLSIVVSMYLACFALGFIIPLSTSAGLQVIKMHHGAAAALYTFSFALVSAIWSAIHNYLTLSVKEYMAIVLLVTAAIMFLLSGLTVLTRPKETV